MNYYQISLAFYMLNNVNEVWNVTSFKYVSEYFKDPCNEVILCMKIVVCAPTVKGYTNIDQ